MKVGRRAPAHHSIANAGARLPTFIDGHRVSAGRPWLAALSRLERTYVELFDGPDSDVLTLGPLALDFSAQSARLGGTAVELTAFEYRLLEFLVRERARVVSKQELADYLYPHDEDRDSNVLEVLMGRLRRKLDPDGTLAPIETLRGRGYRFTLG